MCIKFHLHARMLEECRSNVKEMCLRLLVVYKHVVVMETWIYHGNDVICMRTKFMRATIRKLEE